MVVLLKLRNIILGSITTKKVMMMTYRILFLAFSLSILTKQSSSFITSSLLRFKPRQKVLYMRANSNITIRKGTNMIVLRHFLLILNGLAYDLYQYIYCYLSHSVFLHLSIHSSTFYTLSVSFLIAFVLAATCNTYDFN